MAKKLVVTFVANDRPGLVDRISEIVAEHGGNWLDSRMAHLAEKFAGIALIEIADDRIGGMEDALWALGAEGFHLTVEVARETPAADGPLLTLDIVGPDHPGILHEITHCLAERGASVESLDSEVRGAPMGGGMLFHAQARIRLPENVPEANLQDALEDIAASLMVDIDFAPQNGT